MGTFFKEGAPLLKAASKVGEQIIVPAESGIDFDSTSFYVEWSEQAKSGEVTFESGRAGFAGQWALEKIIGFDGPYRTKRVTFTGAFLAIRIRVTQPVLGGSVDVYGCAT